MINLQYLTLNSCLVSFDASGAQVQNVKAVLRCFKAVPSLKINFAKSEVISARLDESNLLELAKTLTVWVARLIIFLLFGNASI